MHPHPDGTVIDLSQTSEFDSISIYDAIGRINNTQSKPLLLPAIQRHFVWKMPKICKLFDSMMRGYPIGTFLFWEVEDERRNEYAFCEFMRDFSRHPEGCINKTASRSLPQNVTGVLDGQQRLNSMYVALQGSYSEYIGGTGNKKASKDSYPRREFYLNVFYLPDDESKDSYKFAFLHESEGSPKRFDEGHCWFPIHRIYHSVAAEAAWNEFVATLPPSFEIHPDQAARAVQILGLLRRRIREEKLITFFPIKNRGLTEALEIFIRANNGGTAVTDAEMILSTIVAHWPGGKEKIEELHRSIRDANKGFKFEVTHIMLACLALSGCPVRLRIESFKPAHVDVIRDRWENITQNLRHAAKLADDWGLSGNNAVNAHAIIAVATFLGKEIDAARSNEALRLFVLRSLVCEVYRRGERSLSLIRDYADRHLLPGAIFDLGHFESHFELPSGQKMEVTHEGLESLLMLPIGDSRTYVLLSLLHGQHALHQQAFQKDHIHPFSKFAHIREFELGWEREQEWHDWKDRLPNVQLLQDGENNDKRAKPFKDWLPIYRPNEGARRIYLAENDIPENVSLDFAHFDSFFTARRDRLRERLMSLLKVAPPTFPVQPSTLAATE